MSRRVPDPEHTPLMRMARLNQAYLTLAGARAQLESMEEHVPFTDLSDSDPALVEKLTTGWTEVAGQITLTMAAVQVQRQAYALAHDLPAPTVLHSAVQEATRITPRRR